ncbi:hypothetical protein BRDCF_p1815 [Bacteroidales bacterium CF]|nr:hypothetical protein BRDCF_p1815 [Bacteroidales bacterium CF]
MTRSSVLKCAGTPFTTRETEERQSYRKQTAYFRKITEYYKDSCPGMRER